jgi:hypothetical protein
MKPIDHYINGQPIYSPLDLAIAVRPVPIPGVNVGPGWVSPAMAERMRRSLEDAMKTLIMRGRK